MFRVVRRGNIQCLLRGGPAFIGLQMEDIYIDIKRRRRRRRLSSGADALKHPVYLKEKRKVRRAVWGTLYAGGACASLAIAAASTRENEVDHCSSIQ